VLSLQDVLASEHLECFVLAKHAQIFNKTVRS